MPECVQIYSEEEEEPSTGCPPGRQLAEEQSHLRVAYDKWMSCPDYAARAHETLFVAETVPDLPDRSRWIEDATRKINHKMSTDGVLEDDLIGVSLTAWGYGEQNPVVVMGMRRKKQVNLKNVFKGIERDRPTFLTKVPLVIKVKHVKHTAQRSFCDTTNFHQRCLRKKSIITVCSNQSPVENLSRALALSKASIQRDESARLREIYKRIRSSNVLHLKAEANALRKMARVRSEDSVASALLCFDSYYTKAFTITVFAGLDGRHVLYESWAPPVTGRPHMDVVTDGREFHVVTSVNVAFNSGQHSKYCRHCRVQYRFETDHECLECCRHCRKVGVCKPGDERSCRTCKRIFVNRNCFLRHLEVNRAGKSTCELLKMCQHCLEWYSTEGRGRRHICDVGSGQNSRGSRPAVPTGHAQRRRNQVQTAVPVGGFGRPVGAEGSTGSSARAKRRRLDVDAPVRGAAHRTRQMVSPLIVASSSRELGDNRDSSAPETANRSANYSSGPVTRSPSTSTAACLHDSPPAVRRGVGSRQSTLAGPSRQPTTSRAGNVSSGRDGAAVGGDFSAEGGPTPPHPVRALHYVEERKIVIHY